MLADVYNAVPNLFQAGRIDCNLALAIDGSFDHWRISAAHLIREAERWNALGTDEAERIERPSRYRRRRKSPPSRV